MLIKQFKILFNMFVKYYRNEIIFKNTATFFSLLFIFIHLIYIFRYYIYLLSFRDEVTKYMFMFQVWEVNIWTVTKIYPGTVDDKCDTQEIVLLCICGIL